MGGTCYTAGRGPVSEYYETWLSSSCHRSVSEFCIGSRQGSEGFEGTEKGKGGLELPLTATAEVPPGRRGFS